MVLKGIYPFIAVLLILAIAMSGVSAGPQKGAISINSAPPGAEIYLTNESVSPDKLTVSETAGVTPKEFFVDPGNYRIFLKKYGYITWWNDTFTVTAGSYKDFGTVNMTESNPMYGAIHIDTNPPGATLLLQRVVPNVTSVIHSSTPASLESLPPGLYNVNLTRDGYYPYPGPAYADLPNQGVAQVDAGNVTELYVPLKPLPDSAHYTFKSEPTGARVVLYNGNVSDEETFRLMNTIEKTLSGFNGTPEEASTAVDTVLKAETVPPVGSQGLKGLIGTTPVEIDLYKGNYGYMYFLDGYHPSGGNFTVEPNVDRTVEEELKPLTEYVDVYFETNVPGANITINGTQDRNVTPTWVSLPAEKIVNVTFSKPRLYSSKTITVDTSLFVGRPSKWGQIIQLDLMKYFVNASSDDHSTIDPHGIIEVTAGDTKIFNLSPDAPAYILSNMTRIDEDMPPIDPIVFNSSDKISYPVTQIDRNVTLILHSAKKQVYVNATAGNGGLVNNVSHSKKAYDYNTASDVYTFTANDGYVTKDPIWVDGEPFHSDHYQFSAQDMVQNHTLRGEFRPLKVWVDVVVNGSGNVSPSGKYQVDYGGSTPDTTATPNPGYYLKSVNPIRETVDYQSMSAEAMSTIYKENNLTSNLTWIFTFDNQAFNINASSSAGGMIYPAGNFTKQFGENVSFNTTAFAGYQLGDIVDNGVSKGPVNPYNITVQEDHTIYANFTNNVLTITAVAGPGGKIEPNGSVKVAYGGSQSFTITANPNYKIDHIFVNGTDLGGNKTSPYVYPFQNVIKNQSINATFIQNSYTITPSAGTGGSISPSTPQTVVAGGNTSFVITSDGCHTISDVSVDGTSLGPQNSPFTYPFTNVNADHTIHAEFAVKMYNILVNQSEGGSITPNGTEGIVSVACGASQCFAMTPDTGNALYDVLVDGTSVGNATPYCFNNVTSGHTIEPVFVMPPKPDFDVNMTRVPPKYPVYFKDMTRNNPDWHFWDFGDGEVSMLTEPVHYYANVGNYTVTLKAGNAASPEGEVKTKEKYITVTTDPIARFSAKPLGGTVPPKMQVVFTDNSLNTDRVQYDWMFGDALGSQSKNATHEYTSPGVFQVTHRVQKPFYGDSSDYAYETITVLQKPIADFIAHPLSGIHPLQVQFEDKSQGFPTEWYWDFGDGTGSTEQSPVHVYGDAGSFNVTLKVISDEGDNATVRNDYITVK